MLAAPVTHVVTGRAPSSSSAAVVMVAVVVDGHGAVRGPHPAHARSAPPLTSLFLGPFLGLFEGLFGPFWALFDLSLSPQGRRNRLALTLFRDIISPLTQLCVSLLNSLLRHFLRLTRSTATVKVFLDRPAPVRQTAEPPA